MGDLPERGPGSAGVPAHLNGAACPVNNPDAVELLWQVFLRPGRGRRVQRESGAKGEGSKGRGSTRGEPDGDLRRRTA